jgi:hypothetical protein
VVEVHVIAEADGLAAQAAASRPDAQLSQRLCTCTLMR